MYFLSLKLTNMYKKNFLLLISTLKGLKVLGSAISCNVNIKKVIISKDPNVQNDYSQDIINLCVSNSIKYSTNTKDLKVEPKDIVIAVSWKWIINCPTNQLIVFHDSLLPKYRGFAPLVNMLINGEKKIGVTALFGEKKYDSGKIIQQKFFRINYPMKIYDAINIISEIYEEISKFIFRSSFDDLISNAKTQDEKNASYSIWRDEKDYRINWNKSSDYIKRFVDAVSFPYQGAKTLLNENEILIDEVTVIKDLLLTNRDSVKVISFENNKPIIICGKGLLRIDKGHIITNVGNKSLLPLDKFRSRFI